VNHLEHDVVLVRLGINDGDLGLPERTVQGVVKSLGSDTENARLWSDRTLARRPARHSADRCSRPGSGKSLHVREENRAPVRELFHAID